MRTTPLLDRHHIFHERAWYVTKQDKALRQNHLFIPRMDYRIHHRGFPEGLHEHVPPPPKPTARLVLGALTVTQDFWSDMESPEAIKRIADYFDTIQGEGAELGQRVAENLQKQLVYIELGYRALREAA